MRKMLSWEAAETKPAYKLKRHLDFFQEKRTIWGFLWKPESIKMHCKRVGMPSQVRMPKIVHTITHIKQNSLFCCHTFTLEPKLREISPCRNLPSCSFFWSNYLSWGLFPNTSRLQTAVTKAEMSCRSATKSHLQWDSWSTGCICCMDPQNTGWGLEERSKQNQSCAHFSGRSSHVLSLSSPEMVIRFKNQDLCNPKTAPAPGYHRHSQNLWNAVGQG